jgi:hypothetical protein
MSTSPPILISALLPVLSPPAILTRPPGPPIEEGAESETLEDPADIKTLPPGKPSVLAELEVNLVDPAERLRSAPAAPELAPTAMSIAPPRPFPLLDASADPVARVREPLDVARALPVIIFTGPLPLRSDSPSGVEIEMRPDSPPPLARPDANSRLPPIISPNWSGVAVVEPAVTRIDAPTAETPREMPAEIVTPPADPNEESPEKISTEPLLTPPSPDRSKTPPDELEDAPSADFKMRRPLDAAALAPLMISTEPPIPASAVPPVRESFPPASSLSRPNDLPAKIFTFPPRPPPLVAELNPSPAESVNSPPDVRGAAELPAKISIRPPLRPAPPDSPAVITIEPPDPLEAIPAETITSPDETPTPVAGPVLSNN